HRQAEGNRLHRRPHHRARDPRAPAVGGYPEGDPAAGEPALMSRCIFDFGFSIADWGQPVRTIRNRKSEIRNPMAIGRVLLLLLLAFPRPLPTWADAYRLALPANAPAPVRFGAEQMARSLAEAGHRPGRGGVAISVTSMGPGGAEAFAIQRRGAAVRVVGG